MVAAILTGVKHSKDIVRSRCANGHKAMWHKNWGGLPGKDFLTTLDPLLKGFRSRLFDKTETADKPVRKLTAEWAERLGLTTGVVVAGGAFDCHFGAVGADIKPNTLVRIIGISTCDIIVSSYEEMGDKLIKGICGQVDGSVIPGMIGLKAGQSAFGDVYAWFKRLLEFPIRSILAKSNALDVETKEKLAEEICVGIIPSLTAEAEKIPVGENDLISTDWMNGRRTPDANQLLTGSITGITLGSDAPRIKPGISTWEHWWNGEMKMEMPVIKEYIDFASEMGWPYILVDWQWYGAFNKPEADICKPAPQINMPEILQYAKSKNVRIIVWIYSSDVTRYGAYKKAFPLYREWGVAGVKIDFMDRDDQEMVNWYREIIKFAADNRLLVDFHGANIPNSFQVNRALIF